MLALGLIIENTCNTLLCAKHRKYHVNMCIFSDKIHTFWLSHQSYVVDIIICPILQMKKLRHREVQKFTLSHTVDNWQIWVSTQIIYPRAHDFNPDTILPLTQKL